MTECSVGKMTDILQKKDTDRNTILNVQPQRPTPARNFCLCLNHPNLLILEHFCLSRNICFLKNSDYLCYIVIYDKNWNYVSSSSFKVKG